MGDGGRDPTEAEALVGSDGVRVRHAELAFLPLAQKQVIESCMVIVETILHSLE